MTCDLNGQTYHIQFFPSATGGNSAIKMFDANWNTLWQTALKDDLINFSVSVDAVEPGNYKTVPIPAEYQGYRMYFCDCSGNSGNMIANVETGNRVMVRNFATVALGTTVHIFGVK